MGGRERREMGIWGKEKHLWCCDYHYYFCNLSTEAIFVDKNNYKQLVTKTCNLSTSSTCICTAPSCLSLHITRDHHCISETAIVHVQPTATIAIYDYYSSTSGFISSASVLTCFTSFTCHLISFIVTTLTIHHFVILSIQTQDSPLWLFLPSIALPFLPDWLNKYWTISRTISSHANRSISF